MKFLPAIARRLHHGRDLGAAFEHSQLVAFSCMGRRMCATSANLMERVLPEVDLRQWVRTPPFAWRRRLAQDGALLSTLISLFVATVHSSSQARGRCRRRVSVCSQERRSHLVQRTSVEVPRDDVAYA
jgi:hypothetical protein